ncbi:MAG: adenylate kinase [Candidatus Dormibacteraceae bacterium]
MNLLLYGAPGSGKGTQADRLSESLGVPHVATGQILREEVAKGSELGARAKKIMDRGDLVPDEVMIEIIADRLRRADCASGFLLDGFPRTLPQAEALDRMISGLGMKLDAVLYLRVEPEELVNRLGNRWICPCCGRTYSSPANPPAEGNRCPIDGAELRQREDDRPEAARRRIQVYLGETLPVLDYYRPRGVLWEIDGRGTIEEVSNRIDAVLPVRPPSQ